jgi:hypothetical protein
MRGNSQERGSIRVLDRPDDRFIFPYARRILGGIDERRGARPAGSIWFQVRRIEAERVTFAANGAGDL